MVYRKGLLVLETSRAMVKILLDVRYFLFRSKLAICKLETVRIFGFCFTSLPHYVFRVPRVRCEVLSNMVEAKRVRSGMWNRPPSDLGFPYEHVVARRSVMGAQTNSVNTPQQESPLCFVVGQLPPSTPPPILHHPSIYTTT